MNVQCTHCNTVFRVDPKKVPAAGVRARCSVCRGVFTVTAPETAPPGPVGAPPPGAARAPAAPSAPAPAAVAAPAAPSAPAPATAPAPAPAAAAAPAPRAVSPFGSSDPGAKARRLARALVSDIVTYHPERRDRAVSSGTLKQEFREEIRKSWEEFVGQVGTETAHGTPHFRDALNDILARGQRVF
jgi:predicted Zn finger-like uncharacterized protein